MVMNDWYRSAFAVIFFGLQCKSVQLFTNKLASTYQLLVVGVQQLFEQLVL